MKNLTLLSAALFLLGPSAFATPIVFTGTLLGSNEIPAVVSPGFGSTIVTLDPVAGTLEINISFSGLTTNDSAAHIHCCTASPGTGNAGVATTVPAFPGFPLGVTSGTYDRVLNLADAGSYNPAFITAQGSLASAEAAFIAGILAGDTYLNIHTTSNPGGEIRAFLTPVPEPATLLLSGVALLAIGFRRRMR